MVDAGDDPDQWVRTMEESMKTIAFVLYPGFTLLDMVGPLQVLTGLRNATPPYRTVVVGEKIEPVETDTPLKVTPDKSRPLDRLTGLRWTEIRTPRT